MADVARREARVLSQGPRQEPVRERLAGDEADLVPLGQGEDFVDPLLTEQIEGELDHGRLPRLDRHHGLDRLVHGDPVVPHLVLRLELVEHVVRRRIRHHRKRRVVELVHVNVVRPETLQRSLEREGDVSGIEVHAHAAMVEVAADLRSEEHVLAVVLQGLPEDLLAVAPSVDVGCVEKVAAEICRTAHRTDGNGVVRRTV